MLPFIILSVSSSTLNLYCFGLDSCHALTSASDWSFANGTITKSPLSILASAMVLITKPFWTENISCSASVPKFLVCPCFQGKIWTAVVEPCACNRTPVGSLFMFCALRRLSRKFPCTDVLRGPPVTAGPFGEQVKKCMNHLGDSLVGNFSNVSLSACLTKRLFSVCRTPSLFSKSLAASDLYQVSLSLKASLRLFIAFETGFSDQIIGNQASRHPIATPTVRFNILISGDNDYVLTYSAL